MESENKVCRNFEHSGVQSSPRQGHKSLGLYLKQVLLLTI